MCNTVERYKDGIMRVTPLNLSVIQVYMPTSDCKDEEIEALYDYLEEILNQEAGTEYNILLGDWNAVVREGREDECIGKYGLGNRNDRRQKLVDLCKRQNLIVTNT